MSFALFTAIDTEEKLPLLFSTLSAELQILKKTAYNIDRQYLINSTSTVRFHYLNHMGFPSLLLKVYVTQDRSIRHNLLPSLLGRYLRKNSKTREIIDALPYPFSKQTKKAGSQKNI